MGVCRQSGDWKITLEQIAILSRRRSQFRRVTMRMVQYAMKWLDDDDQVRNDKEKEKGDAAAACDILQELQIETFGSMRKKEKSHFLLEQFRLNLAKKDFIRAMIVRNKITLKVLKKHYELEVKYWN